MSTPNPHDEIAAALSPQDEISAALGTHDEIGKALRGKGAPWQDELMDVKLPSGVVTNMRNDGRVWLDHSKGEKIGKGPGWYSYGMTGWKRGPDAPTHFTPSPRDEQGNLAFKDPRTMDDAEIATRLLGMTPEEYLHMSRAAVYSPGSFRKELYLRGPKGGTNSLWNQVTAPISSVSGGIDAGMNAMGGLVNKIPAHLPTWLGGDNGSSEAYSNAEAKWLKVIQNMNQGRHPTQGGFDPLHAAAQFSTGALVGTPAAGGAEELGLSTQAARQLATEGHTLMDASQAAKGVLPYLTRASAAAPRVARDAFLTTPGDVQDRTKAAAVAAGTTPIAHATGDVVGAGFQKLVNLAKGIREVMGGAAAPELPGVAGEVQKLADQHGVEVGAHNLVDNPASKIKAQGELATAAPLGGLGKQNTEQQAQVQKAAQKLLGQLKQRMQKLGYGNFRALEKAAASNDPRATALMKMAQEAGDDPARVLQAEGNINLFAAQSKVNHAFERAKALDPGTIASPESRAIVVNAAKDELARIESAGEANTNTALKNYLKKVVKDWGGAADEEAAAVINGSGDSAASAEAISRVASENAQGRPRYMVNLRTGQATPIPATVDAVDQVAMPNTAIIQKGVGKDPNAWVIIDHNSKLPQHEVEAAMPRISAQLDHMEAQKAPVQSPEAASAFQPTYTGMANFRKGVQNKRADAFTPGAELTGSEATAVLKKIQSATEQAMEAHAGEVGGEVARADKYARNLWKEEILPFKNREVIKALTTETPDKFAARLRTMTPDEIKQIAPVLGPKGQQAASVNMVEDAFKRSLDMERPTDYQFSPLKFAKEMQKQSESLGVVLRGEQKWAVDGFAKLCQHLQTAGKVGSTQGAFTLSQRMLGEPSVMLKWMLTTRPGKQLLLQASDVAVGSPTMDAIIQQINKTAPGVSGTATAQE